MKYLLDTSIVSEPMTVRPKLAVLEALTRHGAESAICAPVWHELQCGCARLVRGKRKSEIGDFLREVIRPLLPVLPYDEAAALWHANERARLERMGKTPAFVDGQIAAIAIVNELTLVTHNTKHFRVFAGLMTETW